MGYAGSNGFRFLRQFIEYGLKDKMAVIGGMTALDESVLRNMGDESAGDCHHQPGISAELDNPLNKAFRGGRSATSSNMTQAITPVALTSRPKFWKLR